MIVTRTLQSFTAIFLLLAMVGGFALIPLTAKATVPTIDFVAIGKMALQLAELIYQSAQEYALVVKEYVLDPAVKLLASIMLQAITQSVLDWIQGGGNTNFVSNLQAALNDAADQAAGEFLNQLAGANLCSPFEDPLRQTLQRGRISLRDRLSCKASDVFAALGTSYDGFLGDFTQGGWLAYSTTMQGSNNYIDALINSYDAKLETEYKRVEVTRAQYQAGQGFLGVNVQKQDCSDGFFNPETGEPICATVEVQTTPGKLVGDELSKVMGSGVDQAVNTDEISEAIDAIIMGVTNKLISSAVEGVLSNNEASGINDPTFSPSLPRPTQTPQAIPTPPERSTTTPGI